MRHWAGSSLVQAMGCCLLSSSHYLNQWWLIVSWTIRNKLQSNFFSNIGISIIEHEYEYSLQHSSHFVSASVCKIHSHRKMNSSFFIFFCYRGHVPDILPSHPWTASEVNTSESQLLATGRGGRQMQWIHGRAALQSQAKHRQNQVSSFCLILSFMC